MNNKSKHCQSSVRWIWYPENWHRPCTFVFFRREFELQGRCLLARGTIAADSRYQLFVNGTRIQRGPAPFDPRYMELDPVDCATHLKSGMNTIGILVCYFGHGEGTYIPGNPGLRFELDIETVSEKMRIVSDAAWRCHRSAAWRAKYQRSFLRALQEDFDARLYPVGFSEIGFIDAEWALAKELSAPADKPVVVGARNNISGISVQESESGTFTLLPREIPFMDESEVRPVSIVGSGFVRWKCNPDEYFEVFPEGATESNTTEQPFVNRGEAGDKVRFPYKLQLKSGHSATVIFKMPEEMTGFPFVTVSAPEGTVVEVMFGEKYNAFVDGKNTLLLPRQVPGQWFRFVTREGETRYETFDYEAVMYLAVLMRGDAEQVKILDAGVVQREYPLAVQPDFSCSDNTINIMFNAAVNTNRNICQETIVDNMVRERNHYVSTEVYGDLYFLHAGDYRLPKDRLIRWAHGQNKAGWFIDCFPSFDRMARLWQQHMELTPKAGGILLTACMEISRMLRDFILYSGDMSILENLYKPLLKNLNWIETLENSSGLLPYILPKPHAVYIDHHGFKHRRHEEACLNIIYYGYLKAIVPIARWNSDEEQACRCEQKLTFLAQAIQSRWWNPDENTYIDNNPWLSEEKELRMHELTISRALMYGLIPKEHIERNLALLLNPPVYMGLAYPCHAQYRYFALAKHGKGNELIPLLHEQFSDERMPSIKENNTFSEFWQGGGSIASLAQVPALYPLAYEALLGIRPTMPGFSQFSLRPAMGMLTQLSGSVATPKGRIVFSGHRAENEYRFEIETPGGVEGKIYVPGIVYEVFGATILRVVNEESILHCSPEQRKTIIILSRK